MCLFYINSTDHIACTGSVDSGWSPDVCKMNEGLSTYLAAPNTRYLAALSVQGGLSEPAKRSNDVRLFFEGHLGNTTALYGGWRSETYMGSHPYTIQSAAPTIYSWIWNDTSMDMYNSAPGMKFGSPFSVSTYEGDPVPALAFRNTAANTSQSGASAYGIMMATSFSVSHPDNNGCYTGMANVSSLPILIEWTRIEYSLDSRSQRSPKPTSATKVPKQIH